MITIIRISFGLILKIHGSVAQANSRKRKPRSKKSKTTKPTKADEVMKSASSDPSSDKRSDDDDDAEEEKVHLHAVIHTAAQTNLVGIY